MKIMNLTEFRKLPPNTLFAKYTPCVFDEFCFKGETWEYDFLVSHTIPGAIKCRSSDEYSRLLNEAEISGKSLEMDFETEGRDGCFEEHQLFAVWEKKDIEQFIERLKRCL